MKKLVIIDRMALIIIIKHWSLNQNIRIELSCIHRFSCSWWILSCGLRLFSQDVPLASWLHSWQPSSIQHQCSVFLFILWEWLIFQCFISSLVIFIFLLLRGNLPVVFYLLPSSSVFLRILCSRVRWKMYRFIS